MLFKEMNKFIWVLIYAFIMFLNCYNSGVYGLKPENVHLSLADNGFDIVVTWTTQLPIGESIVKYTKVNHLTMSRHGTSELLKNVIENQTQIEIHRVILRQLLPDTTYTYKCGSYLSWSESYHFRTFSNDLKWTPVFVFLGDMDANAATSTAISHIQEQVQNGFYSAVWHLGDIFYNFDGDDQLKGDDFMEKITPVAAYAPYMIHPENHDEAHNLKRFKRLFTMPGTHKGLFYSVNVGLVHFLSYSSEIYYKASFGRVAMNLVHEQYDWIMDDLKRAQTNRFKHPWIIAVSHRPMYCTIKSIYGGDCDADTAIRRGIKVHSEWKYGLEQVFNFFSVDLVITAHTHAYERFYPMYKFQYNRTKEPFKNPRSPVHIVIAASGMLNYQSEFVKPKPKYSAYRSRKFGYTTLKVYNRTHLYMAQYSIGRTSNRSRVIDSFWLVQQKRLNYSSWLCLFVDCPPRNPAVFKSNMHPWMKNHNHTGHIKHKKHFGGAKLAKALLTFAG